MLDVAMEGKADRAEEDVQDTRITGEEKAKCVAQRSTQRWRPPFVSIAILAHAVAFAAT
jgi:hypothetical protein